MVRLRRGLRGGRFSAVGWGLPPIFRLTIYRSFGFQQHVKQIHINVGGFNYVFADVLLFTNPEQTKGLYVCDGLGSLVLASSLC